MKVVIPINLLDHLEQPEFSETQIRLGTTESIQSVDNWNSRLISESHLNVAQAVDAQSSNSVNLLNWKDHKDMLMSKHHNIWYISLECNREASEELIPTLFYDDVSSVYFSETPDQLSSKFNSLRSGGNSNCSRESIYLTISKMHEPKSQFTQTVQEDFEEITDWLQNNQIAVRSQETPWEADGSEIEEEKASPTRKRNRRCKYKMVPVKVK